MKESWSNGYHSHLRGLAGLSLWISHIPTGQIDYNDTVGRNTHSSRRIFDLKAVLFSMTDVPPERQKILGLVKGRLPPDDGRM